jgi:acyl-coenzyme A thioesterase PaaI-like protein
MTTPTKRSGPASAVTTPPPGAFVPAPQPILKVRSAEHSVDYESCFGCGSEAANGLKLLRTASAGGVVQSQFTVSDGHQGAPGLAHGGVLAAALDEALGTAAWMLGSRYVTGRLETDFLSPVPVGSTVHLRSWCTGVDGRKAYLEAEGRIGSPDGPMAVRAAALFIEVPEEHFTQEH